MSNEVRATRWSGSDLWPRPRLLANLLEERLGAASVGALVVHDLREQPRLRVLGQDRARVDLESELHTFRSRRPLRSGGSGDRGAMVRRLRLGDVVESGRRLGSSTRAMAPGTGGRATAEGVADSSVPTAQTADLTVHGTLQRTPPSRRLVGSLAWRRPLAPIGLGTAAGCPCQARSSAGRKSWQNAPDRSYRLTPSARFWDR